MVTAPMVFKQLDKNSAGSPGELTGWLQGSSEGWMLEEEFFWRGIAWAALQYRGVQLPPKLWVFLRNESKPAKECSWVNGGSFGSAHL